MTYQEALDFLYQQFPAYQKLGKSAYKADLSNIISLCHGLGNPHEGQKFIHVGGTNGKGSTAHITSAILQSHGLKVGIYSSPHIKDFGERIKINGVYISEDFVISFTERVIPLCDKLEPSFFEITLAMAFEYFKRESTDINIIEVGLGGRLDATNIISPIIAAISNVSLDHVAILGSTIKEIAKEKGGIIKAGIPLALGRMNEESYSILKEMALEKKVEVLKLPDNLSYDLDLLGNHQIDNARLALTIAEEVLPLLDNEKVKVALLNSSKLSNFRGRMEVYSNDPLIILDGAHNEDGVKALIHSIEKMGKQQVNVVYGASNDKELETLFALFPKEWRYHLTEFKNDRSTSSEKLGEIGKKNDLNYKLFDAPVKALKAFDTMTNGQDLIIVFGSFFLLEEFY
jgi:dihydrofolate synthase/folylpolyglutamate synthase